MTVPTTTGGAAHSAVFGKGTAPLAAQVFFRGIRDDEPTARVTTARG